MRLITKANLDGVASAVLITSVESVEKIVFADPKDIEDGSFEVQRGDIIANLPFHPNATTWFDNHGGIMLDQGAGVKGKSGVADSTARLVYDYYNNPRLDRFAEMLNENDRIDRADVSIKDVLNPDGWVLLSYTLDPFMGLEAFHNYANEIIVAIKQGSSIDQILKMTDVQGRIGMYNRDIDDFKAELQEITRLDDKVIITDFRNTEFLPAGNRFIAFALYPEGNVHIRIRNLEEKSKVRIRIGKSVFTRSCDVHIGNLAEEYGGGGLEGAGGCLLDPDKAEQQIADIIGKLKG